MKGAKVTPQIRPPEVQNFIDVTLALMAGLVSTPEAGAALEGIREGAKQVGPQTPRRAGRQPACQHLGDALIRAAATDPRLAPLCAAFSVAEPLLEWTGEEESGLAPGSYAEITLLGPGGHEERRDIWLGLSLLAPHVRYPDHNHAPEEVYLALSDGDFWRETSGWFTPGTGGTFYNQPSVRHAMRSGETPLLAIWALRRV
ncbi:dimethylsulfonioproprionate lyase family protein [Pseudogemmobacter bohemicus]|uniref:dimethylsulfonioproprionate lyase family protein n=1 Tax=Pseudogemmobacter bohemicus TaxID=2250708 RepID=UPI001E5C7DBF|nr:dimethylsulfonioproprionate lyase family protein [Pseudogemmobacter bohemicus]